MSDKIREAFDAWIASVDKRRDANGWQPLTARDVNMLREGYMEAALAQQPAAAVPEGWKLVPVERIQAAIEAVQNAMLDAYSNAYQECCGRGQGQCCGDPDAAWSAEDQRIMDALAPAQRELSALLAAAPAAPVAVKPCGGCGATDESQRCIGCMHQFAPPAAEQPNHVERNLNMVEPPDTVKVPRHTIEGAIALIETHVSFPTAAVFELRALLGKEGKA